MEGGAGATEETLGAVAGRAKNTRGSDNQCLMRDLASGGARRKGPGYAKEEEAAEARAWHPSFFLGVAARVPWCQGHAWVPGHKPE